MASPTIRITKRMARDGRYLGIRFMGALYEEFDPGVDPQLVIDKAYRLADKYHTPREKVKIPEDLKP